LAWLLAWRLDRFSSTILPTLSFRQPDFTTPSSSNLIRRVLVFQPRDLTPASCSSPGAGRDVTLGRSCSCFERRVSLGTLRTQLATSQLVVCGGGCAVDDVTCIAGVLVAVLKIRAPAISDLDKQLCWWAAADQRDTRPFSGCYGALWSADGCQKRARGCYVRREACRVNGIVRAVTFRTKRIRGSNTIPSHGNFLNTMDAPLCAAEFRGKR